MNKLLVKNRFHGTEHTFLVNDSDYSEFKDIGAIFAEVQLTEHQVRRADKVLCGMDCKCGGLWAAGEEIHRYEFGKKYSAGKWIFKKLED